MYKTFLNLVSHTNYMIGVYNNEDINMDGNVRATGPTFINDSASLLSYLGNYTTILFEQLP